MLFINTELACELHYVQVCVGVHTDRAYVYVGSWYSELGVSVLHL